MSIITASSNGIPNRASNRRRWDRACDVCRRRKSRCEIQDDASRCSLCESNDFQCTFVTPSEPRKRRSSKPGDVEQPIKRRSLDLDTHSHRPSIDSSSSFVTSPSSTHIPDDYAKLEGPSLLKETLGLQNHRHSRYLGPSDEFEPACLDLIPFVNDEYDLPNGTLRRVGADDTFLLLPDIKSQNYTDELQDIDAIQRLVEPHGSSLVALYFRIVHPSFPILHKKVFLEKYARNYREFSPPLLAGVYILALNWWVYSPNLALLPKPDAAALQKLALKSLDDVMTRPKLSTIQAGLLISQFLSVDLVPLTARLAAVSQTLGLHRDCSDWRIPDWERGLRRRLIWALFLQDKWVALTHGRDSLVSTSSLNVRFLSSEDFPENATDENHEEGSAEVEKGRRSFSEFIDLSLILADIMEFSGLEFEEGNVEDVLNWAKPLQKRLKDWFSNLPEELRMDDMKVRKLSSIGYLHLAYFTAEITLHRRIVRSFSPSNSTFPNQATSEARTVCRAAARSRFMFALQFIENLRPIHLQSFWYFSSSMNLALIGSFGMLLWATVEASAGTRANAMSGARATVAGGRDGVGGEGINEEVEFYKERIRDLKWGIRVNCKTAEFMEVGLARLEVSTSILGD